MLCRTYQTSFFSIFCFCFCAYFICVCGRWERNHIDFVVEKFWEWFFLQKRIDPCTPTKNLTPPLYMWVNLAGNLFLIKSVIGRILSQQKYYIFTCSKAFGVCFRTEYYQYRRSSPKPMLISIPLKIWSEQDFRFRFWNIISIKKKIKS